MKLDIIYNEDCLEGIKRLSDDSIDLIATDPPYGIAFMGKSWDKALPDIKVWKECLRVLKPGAFAFVMCIPRQDCLARIIVSLEDAGFNVSFSSIYWAYASGFPKAQNIGKAVDKRNMRTQETYKPFAEYLKQKRTQKDLSMGQIDEILGTNTAYSWWEGRLSGIQLPSKKYYLRLKNILDLDNRFDKLIEREEAEREVIGKGTAGLGKNRPAHNGGFKPNYNLTLPALSQAQALDGSYGGFQPKPAVEVVIVAMKPLSEKTYVDQALRNGKGITWLDGGRIPYKAQEDIDEASNKNRHADFGSGSRDNKIYGADKRSRAEQGNYDASKGRFPANLLVNDDVLNDGHSKRSSGKYPSYASSNKIFGNTTQFIVDKSKYNDSGSFSRYFSLDAWFDKKLKELPAGVQKTFPFLIVPKASKAEKNRGCEGLPERESRYGKNFSSSDKGTISNSKLPSRNYHPTVKSLKLFSYFITLGSRLGDVILDPFIGSGTTAIAARMLGRRYIGFETDKDYCKIARARLSTIQLELIK